MWNRSTSEEASKCRHWSSCTSNRQQEQFHSWSGEILGSEPRVGKAFHCILFPILPRIHQFPKQDADTKSRFNTVLNSNAMINRQNFYMHKSAWLLLPFFLTRPALFLSTMQSCPQLLDSFCKAMNTKILHL